MFGLLDEFFADPYGCGAKIDLGNTVMKTSAKIFIYTPKLAIALCQILWD